MARIAQSSNPSAKVIRTYTTVEDFLAALTGNQGQQADVLLAPVYRPIRPGNGVTYIQAGVMLNGQRPGFQRIFSCIALAAEAVLVAERGRLIFPPHRGGDDALVRQRIRTLQEELLIVLCTYLQTDARVRRVRQPESLWVPTTPHWDPNALLGLPIAYQDGHWTVTSDAPEALL